MRNSGRTIPTVPNAPPFPRFWAENGNKDVPFWYYFGFSHALHLLSAVFQNSFLLRKIYKPLPSKPLIPTPHAKIADNCLPLQLCWYFFGVRVPDIISKQKNKKLPFRTRFWISFIFSNGRSGMSKQRSWWHCAKKTAWPVFMFSSYQYKNPAWCGSVLQDTCGLSEQK